MNACKCHIAWKESKGNLARRFYSFVWDFERGFQHTIIHIDEKEFDESNVYC